MSMLESTPLKLVTSTYISEPLTKVNFIRITWYSHDLKLWQTSATFQDLLQAVSNAEKIPSHDNELLKLIMMLVSSRISLSLKIISHNARSSLCTVEDHDPHKINLLRN